MTTLRLLARCRRMARRCLSGSLYGCVIAWLLGYGLFYTGFAWLITGVTLIAATVWAGACAILSGE